MLHIRKDIVTTEEMPARLLACMVGLPRICTIKRCRRHKKCFGRNVICLQHHGGLVEARCRPHRENTGTSPD